MLRALPFSWIRQTKVSLESAGNTMYRSVALCAAEREMDGDYVLFGRRRQCSIFRAVRFCDVIRVCIILVAWIGSSLSLPPCLCAHLAPHLCMVDPILAPLHSACQQYRSRRWPAPNEGQVLDPSVRNHRNQSTKPFHRPEPERSKDWDVVQENFLPWR